MTFRCRKLGEEETEREVEAEDAITAPDEYVAKFFKMHVEDIVFIEVMTEGAWVVWRVECLVGEDVGDRRITGLATVRTTRDKAVAEIETHWSKGS